MMSQYLRFRQLFRVPGTNFLGIISLLAIATQSLSIEAIATPTEDLPSQPLPITQNLTTEATEVAQATVAQATVAQATPVLRIQEIRGTGTATIDGRPASEGSTLGVGEELTTGENTTVRLVVEGRGGSIEVAEYSRFIVGTVDRGDIDLEIRQGRARFAVVSIPGINSASADPSMNAAAKELSFETIPEDSLAQGRSGRDYNFRVRTPTGIAGVRGTTFGVDVGPNGQTGVSGLSGSVVATAQNQDRLVNLGEYVLISPDSAPTIVETTPEQAELKFLVRQTRGGNTVRVFGQVDRLDILYINGQAIETDPDGNFAEILERPTSRRLRFVVRGPAVRERVYIVPVR
jgi:hypothetical protein